MQWLLLSGDVTNVRRPFAVSWGLELNQDLQETAVGGGRYRVSGVFPPMLWAGALVGGDLRLIDN
jgi:hypothetical protein